MNETSGEFPNPTSKPSESIFSKFVNRFKPTTPASPESKPTLPNDSANPNTEIEKLASMFGPTSEKSHQQIIDELKSFGQKQQSQDQQRLDILRKGNQQNLDNARRTQQVIQDHIGK